MSPPMRTPATIMARTPPVTARTRVTRCPREADSPCIRSMSLRLMTMPVSRANGQANPVNGATSPIAVATMA